MSILSSATTRLEHVSFGLASRYCPAMSHLLVEREGHVVTLTMNRPEARNALDLQMLARLADAWQMIDGDDGVRVAILTGAGGHFSSGSDLKQMHNPPDDEWKARFAADPDL